MLTVWTLASRFPSLQRSTFVVTYFQNTEHHSSSPAKTQPQLPFRTPGQRSCCHSLVKLSIIITANPRFGVSASISNTLATPASWIPGRCSSLLFTTTSQPDFRNHPRTSHRRLATSRSWKPPGSQFLINCDCASLHAATVQRICFCEHLPFCKSKIPLTTGLWNEKRNSFTAVHSIHAPVPRQA